MLIETEASRMKAAGLLTDGPEWIEMRRVLARTSLIAYIRSVAPWFKIEEIHCVIAMHLEALADGDIDRLMVFMPPRTGKSMMASVFLPSWWSGRYPSDKILQVGHSVDLSRGFSLNVRELMRLDEYRWIFPGVQLAKDSQAAGKFRIQDIGRAMQALERGRQQQQQGQYKAAGVTSNIAGIGFNLGAVDDAMSEQDKDSKITKDRIWNWWGPGFYTRRQPERNSIVISATRWAPDDLPGHLLDEMGKHHGADTWTQVNVPAILNGDSAKRVYTIAKDYDAMDDLMELKAGDSFAPRRWSLKELMRSKAQLTERDWNSLYMGNPKAIEGHILKSKFWKLWPRKEMPHCDFVFQMYDTAFDEKVTSDFSARTTWGIFKHVPDNGERPTMNMILLERWKKRVDAPDLKWYVMEGLYGTKFVRQAMKELDKDYEIPPEFREGPNDKEGMHPDRVLIENKASGIWLIKELRKIRKPKQLPIMSWNAPRGGRTNTEMSKYQRAIFGSIVLEQGAVWYPNRTWAEEVIDECALCKFDGSDASDDLPDTVSASMIYVRQTYRVELDTDIDEEEERRAGRKPPKRQFYGART
jgi:phage terminase large subunit-like protein